MAHICVVRGHHFPRDTRVLREVEALLGAGYEVDVLCLREPGEPARERRDGLYVRRVPMGHAVGAGPGRLLIEYAAFFTAAATLVAAGHARRRYALVQVNSVPDALVFSALGARLTGARVLLDLQEAMPEFFATRFAAGTEHPAVRVIAAQEQAAIRFAHHAITPTEQLRATFVARGAPPERISVVMDGADEGVFDPDRARTTTTETDAQPPDPGRFRLISHGTIEPHYGLDTVVEAVARLREELPGLELRVTGDGSARAALVEQARRLGVADRVHISEGFLATDDLVAELAAADAGVVAMRRDPFRDLSLAGKMFDFIAMGLPMVASRTRSVQETFPGAYEPFESGDPEDLARAIRRLAADREHARALADRASELAAPLRWSHQRRRYLELVEHLLAP